MKKSRKKEGEKSSDTRSISGAIDSMVGDKSVIRVRSYFTDTTGIVIFFFALIDEATTLSIFFRTLGGK